MKLCPQCNQPIDADADQQCSACGHTWNNGAAKTLPDGPAGSTVKASTIRDLPDGPKKDIASAATVRDDSNPRPVNPSAPTVRQADESDFIVVDHPTQATSSAPTIKESDEVSRLDGSRTTVREDSLNPISADLTLGSQSDQTLNASPNASVNDLADDDSDATSFDTDANDKTLLADAWQTMTRPLMNDADLESHATIPTPSSGSKQQGAPDLSDNLINDSDEPPTSDYPTPCDQPTMFNPQASLEAAQDYSKGQRSVIPPRTMTSADEPTENSDYQMLKRLGAGAFGVVYRAQQVPLERPVAIKLLQTSSDDQLQADRARNEFLREAQFTGRLEHPNIVPIHDIGLSIGNDGVANPFYVMKEIRGQSWHSVIGTKSVVENLEIFKNVVNAIGYAHSQNILHSDLKPDNVMLGEFGEVLVVDWGQAVDLSIPSTMRPGGTPAYISPEMGQYWIDIYLDRRPESPAAQQVGFRSDVYLLGAILFEIIAGHPPHCVDFSESPYAVIRKAAKNYVAEVEEKANNELMQIALSALRVGQSEPIETVDDLTAAIEEYENQSSSVELRRRADQLLDRAKQSGDYDDYQRARYGYEESIEKWPGNVPASQGLQDARCSCARRALNDQNYDLGLEMLGSDDGPVESELRVQLKAGKSTRDRRKKLVAGLAMGLVAAILIGLLGNGYLAWENYGLLAARDKVRQEKNDLQASLAPLEQERKELSSELAQQTKLIDAFPEKLAQKTADFNQQIVAKQREYDQTVRNFEANEEQLKQKQSELQTKIAVTVQQYETETKRLESQKQALRRENNDLEGQKKELAGQVVQLNQSSKLLRYKSQLNEVRSSLTNGDFLQARRQLDRFTNNDWEIKRLNLQAHREVQSVYFEQPVSAFAVSNRQIAIGFENRVEVRNMSEPAVPLITIQQPNVGAMAWNEKSNQLLIGQASGSVRSPGTITVFRIDPTGNAIVDRRLEAQSTRIDQIITSQNGRVLISEGQPSSLRQSTGAGLEEPIMVWDNGDRIDFDLVLPSGARPKFDTVVLSPDGHVILLFNGAGLADDQRLFVFRRVNDRYAWSATCPIQGVTAAEFIPASNRELVLAATDAQRGENTLYRWALPSNSTPTTTVSTGAPNRPVAITNLTATILRLARQGNLVVGTDDARQTLVWDWQDQRNLILRGHSRPAEFCAACGTGNLDDARIVTATVGRQPELLVTELSTYRPETNRRKIGWYAADLPASITSAQAVANGADPTTVVYGDDRGLVSLVQGQSEFNWNISAWTRHVACDDFVFAQSAEDHLYVFDRSSGALLRVMTGCADHLKGRQRVQSFQVADDGQVALIQTDSSLPEFLVWDLQRDQLLQKIDYGRQNLFGTGSQKQLPKLKLSRDGQWVVGAKVGVYAWQVSTGRMIRLQVPDTNAPRSVAGSLVFERGSQRCWVSWGQRVAVFDIQQETKVDQQRLPKIADSINRPNLLAAIRRDGRTQLLTISQTTGGLAVVDWDRPESRLEISGATTGAFVETSAGVTVVAAGVSPRGQLKMSLLKPEQNTVTAIDARPLKDKFGDSRLNRIEAINWSPSTGLLLQTTQRLPPAIGRAWNSVGFQTDSAVASPTAVQVLAAPRIDSVVSDGQKIVSLSNGQVLRWRITQRGVQACGIIDDAATSICLLANPARLAVGRPDGRCQIFDLESGQLLRTYNLTVAEIAVTAIADQPTTHELFVGNAAGQVFKIDTVDIESQQTGALSLRHQITTPISRLAFSQSGNELLIVAPQQGSATVLSLQEESNETMIQVTNEQAIVTADISANGRRIVTGSIGGRVSIWHIEPEPGLAGRKPQRQPERELIRLPRLHQSPIAVVRFYDQASSETIISAEKQSGKNEIVEWPAIGKTD